MKKITLFLFIFQSFNLFGQITVNPEVINGIAPSGLYHKFANISSDKTFAIGVNKETLNFVAGGTDNVGLGTYTTRDGVLIQNVPTSPFYNNHGKFHIWHHATYAATQSSPTDVFSGGPQLLLDQNAIYSPVGPPIDFYSRLQFRSTGTYSLGNSRHLKKGNTWELKAKSYVYAYPFIGSQPDFSTEDFVINHSVGGDAVTIMGNGNIKHHGYSMLGNASNTPNIKMVLITTNLASTQNAHVTAAHGLDPLKIISVTALASTSVSASNLIPANNASYANSEYSVDINGANIILTNSGSSTNVLSQPCKVVITYIE